MRRWRRREGLSKSRDKAVYFFAHWCYGRHYKHKYDDGDVDISYLGAYDVKSMM